jgi:hypothetical protein
VIRQAPRACSEVQAGLLEEPPALGWVCCRCSIAQNRRRSSGCRLGWLSLALPGPTAGGARISCLRVSPRSEWRGMADEPSAPPRQQASCCLLFRACNGHGLATARKMGQHVASSAALHGTTRSLPHCHIHRCHSPFDPACVCLTCHWLTDLWILWVQA